MLIWDQFKPYLMQGGNLFLGSTITTNIHTFKVNVSSKNGSEFFLITSSFFTQVMFFAEMFSQIIVVTETYKKRYVDCTVFITKKVDPYSVSKRAVCPGSLQQEGHVQVPTKFH